MGLWHVIPMRQQYREGVETTATNGHLISQIRSPPMWFETKCVKHDLDAVWKELNDEVYGR